MEFHNVKLLPKGLPEIITQFVPYDVYPRTKVIVYPRKVRKGVAGSLCSEDDGSFLIKLYPTIISFYNGSGIGVFSFRQWYKYLETALHEVGHLATRRLWEDIPDYSNGKPEIRDWGRHIYVEKLAIEWANRAMAKILSRDARLGQPLGALTGYPGIMAHKQRHSSQEYGVNYVRVIEWRALDCDAQLTSSDIAGTFYGKFCGDDDYKHFDNSIRKVRKVICQVAQSLDIDRYYTSKTGKRYLMFNAGEAEVVYERLVENKATIASACRKLEARQEVPKHYKWELVNSNWELVEIETPIEVSSNQLALPLWEGYL